MVNQDLDADREGLQGEEVCVVGKHGHYADFSFSFKMLEEYFLFFWSAARSPATYAAHFYAPARVVRGTEIWESGQLWMAAC